MTHGDPRGIGPELVEAVLADPPAEAEFVVIGAGLGPRASALGPTPPPRAEAQGPRASRAVEAGREVGRQIEEAVRLALAGAVQAIVTGPAEKRALHAAGYDFPGQTEWLGALAGGVDTAMMLAVPGLRVVLATTHVALRHAVDLVTADRVVRAGTLARAALRDWWGIAEPRLAVCALNPHAGEGGAFGAEDDAILRPAAQRLGAAGPIPADTVFVRALRGEFDAVVAPYHDVGMTAVKVAGFGRGVNLTLGLPFIRTAPDHGTAFDIAGKGVADASSMREAVRLAVQLVERRRARGG